MTEIEKLLLVEVQELQAKIKKLEVPKVKTLKGIVSIGEDEFNLKIIENTTGEVLSNAVQESAGVFSFLLSKSYTESYIFINNNYFLISISLADNIIEFKCEVDGIPLSNETISDQYFEISFLEF